MKSFGTSILLTIAFFAWFIYMALVSINLMYNFNPLAYIPIIVSGMFAVLFICSGYKIIKGYDTLLKHQLIICIIVGALILIVEFYMLWFIVWRFTT